MIPGDLVYSKLHQGWCLVLTSKLEHNEIGRKPVVRIKVLHTAKKAEFHIALPEKTTLATLTNYEFYRDGERLL